MRNKFTKSNFIAVSKEVLEFQLNTIYPIKIQNDPIRANLIFLNHDRNFSTFLTMKYLVQHERVADIFTLSRSMFESIITMGLLAKKIVTGDIERYQEFQYLEIHKTYNHLKRLGFENLSGVSTSEAELVAEKRATYIKKWGRSIDSWTGKSLEENVRLVDNIYPPTCNESHFYEYLYCQVYRKGSQSSHSSYAGLSKGVLIETFSIPGMSNTFRRFKTNENYLVFPCFHSIIVFASSVRFLGYILGKDETESHFQKIARYIISE